MNRIEFMTELAALLQDVPVIERQEAMKYYNDYFDDAGVENEHRVIEELESPSKVAATIKADLESQTAQGREDYYGEYSETGYRDTRFDRKDMPAGRTDYNKEEEGAYRSCSDTQYQEEYQEPPKTSPVLKARLIIAIIIFGAPIIIPLAIAAVVTVMAVFIVITVFFFALVIGSVSIAVAGVVLFFAGIWALVPEIAVGLALIGTGLILGVIGVILTVASIRLCTIVLPGIFRGIVWVFRKPFHRKAVV